MAGGLFRLLGPLEAWDGKTWVGISAAKERALLAMLLLHAGQPVSSDRLVAELWGDRPPGSALNSLSVYVHNLRKLTGDPQGRVLVTRAPGYQARLGAGDLDAERFTRLAAEGGNALATGDPERAASLLTEALACWRGSALVDVRPTPLIAAEADRLEQARVEARRLLAEADLACGRAGQVVARVQRLLADHPLREEFWALLMRALQRAGRQAEALDAYDKARHVLAEELGTDPGAELQQIYQKILNAEPLGPDDAGAPGTRRVVPAQLPADITDFTGRAGQVERLCELLSPAGADGGPGAVRVVVVVGSGGLGKTTLAVHAAHRLAEQFSDGQLYANLHGATQPADPAEVLARFLRDLGADAARIPVSEEERAGQFRTMLAGKKVLILLDDARDAAQVRPLLPGSASAAVLVTARTRLPELAGSKVIDLAVLSTDEARSLFSGMVDKRRALAEPEATSEVLTACAGLPLAIRIAGARLAARENWTVATLARRLSDEHRRLDELRAGNLAVRTSFEVSFATLPRTSGPDGVDPAQAFRLLGLWTGPSVSLAAAVALLGEPEDAVADALDVLVDAHLLESPQPEAYRFHDLLRVYAADRARKEESEQHRRAAIIRLLAWYLHTTEAAARVIYPQHTRVPLGPVPQEVQPLDFDSLDEALRWCEGEQPGLVAATRLASGSGAHETAWKLAAASMSFFRRRSHWSDWIASHQTGLASARVAGDRLGEAWMLNNLGMAYGQQSMEQAIDCFEQALVICRETGDAQGEARAASNVAQACLDLGRFGEALAAAERSLLVQQRTCNRYGEGLAHDYLGTACRALGRLDEAMDHLNQALSIFREVGSRTDEAESLADLGTAYLDLDRVEDAVTSLSQALVIRQDTGDRRGEALTLRGLSRAMARSGDLQRARGLLDEALRLFEQLGDQGQAAQVRREVAATWKSAG